MDGVQEYSLRHSPKISTAQVKRTLRFTEEDTGFQLDKRRNRGYFIFLMLTGILLVAAVYCKLSEVSLLENCWDFAMLVGLTQNAFISLLKAPLVWHALKALCIGILVLFLTWGVMYFDSTTPGIEPPSPLSPQRVRVLSGHTFHSGYILAVVNGLLCTIFFLLWT